MKRLILILALALSLLLISCASTDNSTATSDDASTDTEQADTNTESNTESSDSNTADTGANSGLDDSAAQGGSSNNEAPSGSDDSGTQSKGGEVNNVNEFILKARVVGKNDTHLEIEVIESDYAFGVYWVIVPSSTPILSAQKEVISLDELSAGTVVEITYNGQTMMSYPPQIVALSINVK